MNFTVDNERELCNVDQYDGTSIHPLAASTLSSLFVGIPAQENCTVQYEGGWKVSINM